MVNRHHSAPLALALVAVVLAGCAPTTAPDPAETVRQLAAVEVRLAALSAGEPRHPGDDGQTYFAALVPVAQEGWRRASELRAVTATAGTAELAASYASLEGAARVGDVGAARRARQRIATAMATVQSTPQQRNGG
ncbi:hypothetical protein JOF53_000006 [Crossiella equi]|uniref:DUF4398 domain-containing protein n=1 Tax=Crossiella equi TaxID=130796 RepID=A0ABS5A3I9_9PSEU|nr:hypothetical protein [Crossiella equi]MBP2471134.1 hypothetical protein [Crossiella equi]